MSTEKEYLKFFRGLSPARQRKIRRFKIPWVEKILNKADGKKK